MTSPFKDLNLDNGQISANYTWKQINITNSKIDSKVYDNLTTNYLIVSNSDNTFNDDIAFSDVTLIGTNLTNTDSGKIINIGHGSTITNCDSIIKIGGTEGGNDSVADSNNNIIIGYDNSVGVIGASNNNVVIGNNNSVTNGSNNVLIGHELGFGAISDNLMMISTEPLPNGQFPQDGSVLLGGNNDVSGLPRFQLLQSGLLNLQGAVAANGLSAANDIATPANIAGYMRIRYKNRNLLIPVLLDADDITLSPPPN